MKVEDILKLPAVPKKTALRHIVQAWLPQHNELIKRQAGYTHSTLSNNMLVSELTDLARLIQTNHVDADKWLERKLDGIKTGTDKTESPNIMPLLEGVSAENLYAILLRIAYLSKVTDHDAIVKALRQTHRIHSSFEPVMASAELLFRDCKFDGTTTYPKLFDEYENIVNRTTHFLGVAEGSPSMPEPKTTGTDKLIAPTGELATMANAVLKSIGLPPVEGLVSDMNRLKQEVTEAKAVKLDLENKLKKSASLAVPMPAVTHKATGSMAIPNGTSVVKKAYDVFGMPKKDFDFDIPMWEWDADNPHVPVIDKDYIFREEELKRFLYAVMKNQRAYFYGDTGTGKTTLIEQGSGRLGWMFKRVNLDSEVSRYDFIGRETLTTDGNGNTISKFVEGILPQSMAQPIILCLDEIDFGRPDILYALQGPLEGGTLTLTEDGGRIVNPHAGFRMFATGNTQGQGDEKGMYQGARPQSMAFLDRFTIWCKVDYLEPDQRKKLLKSKCPGLQANDVDVVCQYVTEHLEAFTNARVMQPISPRGMIALGQAIVAFNAFETDKPKEALKRAFSTTITDRATSQDFAVLDGIVDALVK